MNSFRKQFWELCIRTGWELKLLLESFFERSIGHTIQGHLATNSYKRKAQLVFVMFPFNKKKKSNVFLKSPSVRC